MNALKVRTVFSLEYLTAILVVLEFGCCAAGAQTKSTTPAPPKITTSTAPKPATPAARPAVTATGTTAKGPTTASPTHGPTTANPRGSTTPAGSVTTANPARHTTATGAHPTMGGRPVPRDSRIVHTPNGAEVRVRANGRPADLHFANRGMEIHHGLDGRRRVEVERADHSRIVAERGGRGYIQRPYTSGGREFAHRTYYYHGRVYDRYYGRYYYGGHYVHYYAPVAYYRPAFYGWAYYPWVALVHFEWGWAGRPWYGYYGYYFAPYPVYPSPSLWLTDYMISATLAAAYQAQIDAAVAAQTPPPDAVALTPAVKDMIAAEVQGQIALENKEGQAAQTAPPDPALSSIQLMLTDHVQHVFVAGRDLDVVDAAGQECAVSEGDALQLTGPPAPYASTAGLIMLSSKGGPECRRGDTVAVTFSDLQEMQNHMRETIDQGMAELQAKQGSGGLPVIPAQANGEPVKAPFAMNAPGPEANAAAEINQQTQAADRAENEAVNQVAQNSVPAVPAGSPTPAPLPPPAPPPATVSRGQTIDEVTAIKGKPENIYDVPPKKIYVFKDVKVTFRDGKVTDVQ
jgi:hypothetical protein